MNYILTSRAPVVLFHLCTVNKPVPVLITTLDIGSTIKPVNYMEFLVVFGSLMYMTKKLRL
jgi:hypothetical protein